MFRNVRYYSLESVIHKSEQDLSDSLQTAAFEPCGPLTERSSGWVAVHPDEGDRLARRVNGADLVRMRSQSRVLPASVVNEELEKRIEEYRNRMQENPRPREKRRLKAESRDELLPKALLKSDRVWGYIDLKENVLGIDAAQSSVAERFLRRMRASIPDLKARPLQFQQPVSDLLTRIFLGDAPSQFVAGRECRMQDAGDSKSVVRWANFDLNDNAIRNHVASGMHLTHLAIEYNNVLGFVLDENGVISKLRYTGMDEDDNSEGDPLAKLDTEFVLISGSLRQLLADLKKLLGGYG